LLCSNFAPGARANATEIDPKLQEAAQGVLRLKAAIAAGRQGQNLA
jgi:hypothetical protein